MLVIASIGSIQWSKGLTLVLGCSSMNARVFMVFVFSSIFMGVWNSDQAAMNAAIARNKRLNRSVAAIPIPPVENVCRENMSPLRSAAAELGTLRVVMRVNDNDGETSPVVEQQEDRISLNAASAVSDAVSDVASAPLAVDAPEPRIITTELETITAQETVEVVGPETVTIEPTTTSEPVLPELAESEEILSAGAAAETLETDVLGAAVIVKETEPAVNSAPEDLAVTVDTNATTVEKVADHSAEIVVSNEQPNAESTEAELSEPIDQAAEETVAGSHAVALQEAKDFDDSDGNDRVANGEHRSLAENLLQTGENDSPEVRDDVVSPGTVKSLLDGGAAHIPLPRGFASGAWQVIQTSSEIFRITVDRDRKDSVEHGGHNEEAL